MKAQPSELHLKSPTQEVWMAKVVICNADHSREGERKGTWVVVNECIWWEIGVVWFLVKNSLSTCHGQV